MLASFARLGSRSLAVGAQRSFSRAVVLQYADNAAGGSPELTATFKKIEGLVSEDLVKSVGARYQFDLKGVEPCYVIDLKTAPGKAGPGPAAEKPDVTMTLEPGDFVKMFDGKLNPTSAFMSGKLKIKGDIGLAMKLQKLIKK